MRNNPGNNPPTSYAELARLAKNSAKAVDHQIADIRLLREIAEHTPQPAAQGLIEAVSVMAMGQAQALLPSLSYLILLAQILEEAKRQEAAEEI